MTTPEMPYVNGSKGLTPKSKPAIQGDSSRAEINPNTLAEWSQSNARKKHSPLAHAPAISILQYPISRFLRPNQPKTSCGDRAIETCIPDLRAALRAPVAKVHSAVGCSVALK